MSVKARKVGITVKAAKTSRAAPLVRTDVSRSTHIGKRTDHHRRFIEKTVSQQRSAKLSQTTTTVRKEPVRWIAALEIFAMLPQYHWSAPSSSAHALFWPPHLKP